MPSSHKTEGKGCRVEHRQLDQTLEIGARRTIDLMQQEQRLLEEGIGHGAAEKALKASAVAQEEEGQERRQHQRWRPGHDADGDRLQMIRNASRRLRQAALHRIGELGVGQGRPMVLECAQGAVKQLRAALDVPADDILPTGQVGGDPGREAHTDNKQQREKAEGGAARRRIAAHAAIDQRLHRRIEKVIDDQRQQEGHHQPEDLLEEEQQQAGGGDDRGPDDGTGAVVARLRRRVGVGAVHRQRC
jgi:uncharacterized protein YajQ (UPF0234 family)